MERYGADMEHARSLFSQMVKPGGLAGARRRPMKKKALICLAFAVPLLFRLTSPYTFVRYASPSLQLRCSCVARAANSKKKPHPANVEGTFYVDHTCIDCDTCRWMAPGTFGRTTHAPGGQSYVYQQPEGTPEVDAAVQAMISCPTGSIRTNAPLTKTKDVLDTFPILVDERLPQVFHLGYHSPKSFGAASYFLKGGTDKSPYNVMYDSPRYSSRLANLLEAAGGVQLMVLSHKDDVADHERWKERFPAMTRVMHQQDVRGPSSWPYIDMTGIEMQLDGDGPWQLEEGLKVVYTPGHSAGSITLIADATRTGGDGVAFTGDHLALNGRLGRLDGFARYSDDTFQQADSIQKLAEEEVLWILPGHGRRIRFEDPASRERELQRAAQEYRDDPRGQGAPGPLYQVLQPS